MKNTPKDDDRNALENALGAINRTPKQEKLPKVATDVHDPEAVSVLRDLVHGDFERLDTSTQKEKVVAPERKHLLLATLKGRFESNPERFCQDINPVDVTKALEAATEEQWYGLSMMEQNGHQVRVVRAKNKDGKKGFRFDSCSDESPAGVRNISAYKAKAIAQEWGIDLQEGKVFDAMGKRFGFNKATSDHLFTDDKTLETDYSVYGISYGNNVSFNALHRAPKGGFRGSLWISEA